MSSDRKAYRQLSSLWLAVKLRTQLFDIPSHSPLWAADQMHSFEDPYVLELHKI